MSKKIFHSVLCNTFLWVFIGIFLSFGYTHRLLSPDIRALSFDMDDRADEHTFVQQDSVLCRQLFLNFWISGKDQMTRDVSDVLHKFQEIVTSKESNGTTYCEAIKYLTESIGYFSDNNYILSLEKGQMALSILDSLQPSDTEEKSITFLMCGNSSTYLGEFDQAIRFLLLRLDYLLRETPDNKKDIAIIYTNIAVIYMQINLNKEAFQYLNEALRHVEEGDWKSLRLIYANFSSYYNKIGDIENAIRMELKAIESLKYLPGNNNSMLASSYTELGSYYNRLKEYSTAIEYIKMGIELIQIDKPNGIKNDLFYSYYNISYIYEKLCEYKYSDQYMDSALYHTGFTTPERFSEIQEPRTFQAVMFSRSDFEKKRYNYDSSVERLYNARQYDELAIQFEEFSKKNRSSSSSFLNASRRHEILGNALHTLVLLYQHTDSIHYAYQAYTINRKIKDKNQLNQGLAMKELLSDVEVPDTVYSEFRRLNTEILKNRLIFNSMRQSDMDIADPRYLEANKAFQNSIYDKEQYFSNFQQTYLKEEHLFYPKELSYDEIHRKTLFKDSEVIIDYYLSRNGLTLTTFVLSQNKINIKSTIFEKPLDSLINTMNKQMLDRLDDYYDSAFDLYTILVKPIEEVLNDKMKLLIIPDGILNSVAFNALVTKLPDSGKRAEYLIDRFCISSKMTFHDNPATKKTRNRNAGVLAVAPAYQHFSSFAQVVGIDTSLSRSYFGPLPYNMSEAKDILELTGGRGLIGEDATRDAFLNNISDYSIIHLASHGKSFLGAGYACLMFEPSESHSQTEENGFLYYEDVNNLNLNTDMVVLSACETGIGREWKGEGAFSMARSFFIAGAKSVIMTLWVIDDKSTKDIMVHFYKSLKAGSHKDESLRAAQLKYLSDHPDKHPYYWAAFVPVGDMSPLFDNNIASKYYYLLMALGGGLLIFIFTFRHRLYRYFAFKRKL